MGLFILNLCARYYLLRYNFKLVFVEDGAKFYVAADKKTRKKFEDWEIIAFAQGEYVFARTRRTLTKAIIRHELKHVEQARKYGVMFEYYYWKANKNGYSKNKFERAAKYAEKLRKKGVILGKRQ